ncbi:hypothetical protein H696_00016 [Fonticula alba]|uniref:EGF-like domain-containing protein n=1 Tax=Fonticula alba TaxID=691883 RepID=A0A058ZDE1_FONAL|nr:hypothetical protein H696_00016 [Fonticula alba]KCV72430.1 hypothetical protein H696_00016 [Fonticula alba]|eukprot:XP_009492131.1 hypothetical protein H696_00016 [Fonticula alba]
MLARYTGDDIVCDRYRASYRPVDGFAFLNDELPDMAVSSAQLLAIGPPDCWHVLPGSYNACAVCRYQAAPDRQCRPAAQPIPGCQTPAHAHLNEECSVCAEGHWMAQDRRCVSACPAADHVTCGMHCIPRHQLPDGFDCAAWPMASMAPSPADLPGVPAAGPGRLLNCSAPGVCFQCHANCAQCAGPGPKDCTACPAGRLLLAHSTKPFANGQVHVGACVRGYGAGGDRAAPHHHCPATTVPNGQGACLPCRQHCLTCDPANPAMCRACLRGFFAQADGTCGRACPAGTARDSLTGRCAPCADPHCARCASEDPGLCLACQHPGHVLHENVCEPACPAGKYPHQGRCHACAEGCASCASADHCLRCQEGHTLQAEEGGTCVPACPGPGSTWDLDLPPGSRACRPCAGHCLECHRFTDNCTACPAGMLLVRPRAPGARQSCVAQCPEGYFPDGGHCEPCLDPECAVCDAGARTCTECKTGHGLFANDACLATCPEGYYRQGKQCHPCGGGCGTCRNGLGASCLQCSVGPKNAPLPKQLEPGSFNAAAPARCVVHTLELSGWGFFYQDQKNRYAVPCPANCITCYVEHPHDAARRAVQCLLCKPTHVLSEDRYSCVPV